MSIVIDNRAEGALLERVDAGGGFTSVTLNDLKQVIGVMRLGKFVLEDIKDWLRRQDLGYFPLEVLDDNPVPRQDQELRIYRSERTSTISTIVKAVLDPSSNGDRALRQLTGDSTTQRVEDLTERIERAKAALDEAVVYLSTDAR